VVRGEDLEGLVVGHNDKRWKKMCARDPKGEGGGGFVDIIRFCSLAGWGQNRCYCVHGGVRVLVVSGEMWVGESESLVMQSLAFPC
jgi:hypothetical protein